MGAELEELLTFVLDLLRDYGLADFYLELSTRDEAKEKFVGSDEDWADATETLAEAAQESGLELVDDPGGAAFYGPKISVQARDAIGRTWQLSTIQVDFQMPQRFDLEYQAADGARQRPVMIHRALFGSIERFFGVLTEHYAGAFPPWLAPVQVVGIPIADAHVPYLEEVAARLREHGIRVEVDACDERMQKKIRNAQRQKVPYMLIAGDADVAAGAVSFRYRDGSQRNGVPVDEAIERDRRPRSRPRAGVTGRPEAAPMLHPCRALRRPALPRGRGRPRRLRAALDAAPDGLHRARRNHGQAQDERAARGRARSAGRRAARRRGAGGRARGADLHRAEPLPVQPGHLMVCPYRHVADYTELTEPRPRSSPRTPSARSGALREASGAHGFNVGMNQGGVAGAGHRRAPAPARGPRWGGDTNFMPVVGRTKVLPQLLARHPQAAGRGLALRLEARSPVAVPFPRARAEPPPARPRRGCLRRSRRQR